MSQKVSNYLSALEVISDKRLSSSTKKAAMDMVKNYFSKNATLEELFPSRKYIMTYNVNEYLSDLYEMNYVWVELKFALPKIKFIKEDEMIYHFIVDFDQHLKCLDEKRNIVHQNHTIKNMEIDVYQLEGSFNPKIEFKRVNILETSEKGKKP